MENKSHYAIVRLMRETIKKTQINKNILNKLKGQQNVRLDDFYE